MKDTHTPAQSCLPWAGRRNTDQYSALSHYSESISGGVWETETGRMAHVLWREVDLKRRSKQGTV